MQYYVGIDHHRGSSFATVMKKNGEIISRGSFKTRREEVHRVFENLEGSQAVLEAGRNWPMLYEWLEEEGLEVKLAHPQKVKAIAEAKIKNDKIDSKTLAHLLRANLIPEAHVPDRGTREAKRILRQRMFFVKLQTMVKNRISILLEGYPEIKKKKPTKSLFSDKSINWMKNIELREKDKKLMEQELKLLKELMERITKSDELINKLYQEDKAAKYLKSLPGIGKFFAVLISNEIDKVSRFRNHKKLASYCGLIPSTYSSGTRTVHGRITKRGNKWLRWAFVEAVWPAIKKDKDLRKYYYDKKKTKPANVAKVATARRLLIIAYKLLKEKRNYEIRRRPSFFTS